MHHLEQLAGAFASGLVVAYVFRGWIERKRREAETAVKTGFENFAKKM